MSKLRQTLFTLALAGVASTLAALVSAQHARPQGPCDIYAAAGTPCVTAHSTVRSLSSRYGGPLYQVKRADGRQLDIGVIAGGFADAAAPAVGGGRTGGAGGARDNSAAVQEIRGLLQTTGQTQPR